MTLAELMAIPEVPDPQRAVWREDDDPVLIDDGTGRAWSVARIKGERVRYRMPMYDAK